MIRRTANQFDDGFGYWPAFVDLLASLFMIAIILLTFGHIQQSWLSSNLQNSHAGLQELQQQLHSKQNDINNLLTKQTDLKTSMTHKDLMLARLEALLTKLQAELYAFKTADSQKQEILQQNKEKITTLEQKLLSLQAILGIRSQQNQNLKLRISDLEISLQKALAERVQELEKYRSEFFGRLRDILGKRSDIQISGDRYILQSELLFEPGSAKISRKGRSELKKIARIIQDIIPLIPPDLAWVLRVDGHTDRQPISGRGRFASNWELSVARAVNVVSFLQEQGLPPQHLAAAGFGEHRPIDNNDTPEAYNQNRRIEFKFTEK